MKPLLNKDNLSEKEQLKLAQLQSDIIYLSMLLKELLFVQEQNGWKKGKEFKLTSNPIEIAEHINLFYENVYLSSFNSQNCEYFPDGIKKYCPKMMNDDKQINKLAHALKLLKSGKSPATEGLPVEFYSFFLRGGIIETPLFKMFKDCIDKSEMTTTMKQGLICLILKPNKSPLSIESWRPIT